MLASKCPGQDLRYWNPEDIYEENCPNCGNELEFWKTDIRLRCDTCKEQVTNPRFDMGCAKWCSYAEQCLGGVVKGFGPSDSFLERIKGSLQGLFQDEELERIHKILAFAEQLSVDRGAELMVVVIALCFLIIRERFHKEEAQDTIERLIQQVPLPERAVKKAEESLEEVEREDKKSLNARMIYKVMKLQPFKKEGRK